MTDRTPFPIRLDPALLERWMEDCAQILETFSGNKHQVSGGGASPAPDDVTWWQQSFHAPVGAALAIGMESAAQPAFAALLGADDVSAGEVEATCGELLTNIGCHMAQRLGTDAGVDLDAYPGVFSDPPGRGAGLLHEVKVSRGGNAVGRLWIAFTQALSDFYQPQQSAPAPGPAPAAPAPSLHDALLDMSMPLIVSLGRVNVTLEQAFQLTTGALLELGCTADDPAELIVNGVPFARGHVVIVDGNYGLQITELLQRPGSLPQGAQKGAPAVA